MRKIAAVFFLAMFAVFPSRGQVVPGIEVLRENGFDVLRGKKVGLLTNPSGVDRSLKSTIDILSEAPGVELVRLFGPEHGVRGDHYAGDSASDFTDPRTGLKVYSLYGAHRQPTQEMLSGLDAVVYDIQDVGCRSYTFISSLGLLMRSAAEAGIEVVVLDRPNPLGGLKIEGPYPLPGFFSFVGEFRIPYIYGLTVGELASLINSEGLNRGQKGDQEPLSCHLTVVPMKGWKRSMRYADTGLPWILPSPNIPYAETAVDYPCSGLCGELGYMNIGVGYTLPFSTFAAEWIDADTLCEALTDLCLPGVAFRPIHYKPFFGSREGVPLSGVQFEITDFESADLTLVQFYVMQVVHSLYPDRNPFEGKSGNFAMFDKVCGSDFVRLEFSRRFRVSDIVDYWTKDVEIFRILSSRYYLY